MGTGVVSARRAGLVLALVGAGIGVAGLVVLALGRASLTAVIPGRPQMVANTGVAVLIAGLAGALRYVEPTPAWRRALSAAGGLVVLAIGALTLVEYFAGLSLGIDQLVPFQPPRAPYPGRPSPVTALTLVPLGAALVLFDVRFPRAGWAREWLALAATFLAFVSFVGHVLGVDAFYEFHKAAVIGVALPTAVALLCTSLSLPLLRPDVGFMRLATSKGPGGVMVRRLGLVAALASPVAAAALFALVHAIGLEDLPLAVAVGAVLATYFALGMVVVTAMPLEAAHEATERAHARMMALLVRAPEGIFVADLEGRYIDVNEAGCRLLQCTRDEILGKTIMDFIHASEVDRLWAVRERLLRGETDVSEWSLRRKDGAYVPVEVSASILPDGRWQGFTRDITDRVALQRGLAFLARAGEELAATLEVRDTLRCVASLAVDFLGDMCVIDMVGADGTISRALVKHADAAMAERASRLVRYAPARDKPNLVWQVLETRRSMVAPVPNLYDAAAISEEHASLLRDLHPLTAMLVPLIARGQLVAVLSVVSCTPARSYGSADLRIAEELARRAALALDNARLYQESRLLGAVTTNLSEGVVLVRREDLRIVYANPRSEALLGYAPGEMIGRPVASLHAGPSSLMQQDVVPVAAALDRDGHWHGELPALTKDGRESWFQVSVATFEHAEHGTVWIAVHTDITARRALEEANARALREKEVLLREIHHRVKNNLQVVSSLFSLQRSRTRNDEVRALLDESRTRIQSIALVHEHLYQSADLSSVDFEAYLHGLIASIQSTYGNPRVHVVIAAHGIVLDPEHAVPCALAVGELVSNAFKHAFAGRAGTLRVEIARDGQGGYVLEVADDGPGLPADLDWTSTSTLGLRLVRTLVRQLEGTVEVDRARGTRFVIRFRIGRAQERPVPAFPTHSSAV